MPSVIDDNHDDYDVIGDQYYDTVGDMVRISKTDSANEENTTKQNTDDEYADTLVTSPDPADQPECHEQSDNMPACSADYQSMIKVDHYGYVQPQQHQATYLNISEKGLTE